MKIKIRPTDSLFSIYIRNRDNWRCQRCFRQHEEGSRGLQNSHFWGRAHESTRFDPENCDSICHGCHSWFHANPQAYSEWKKQKIGARAFKLLEIRARSYKKKDDKLTMLAIRKLLNKL